MFSGYGYFIMVWKKLLKEGINIIYIFYKLIMVKCGSFEVVCRNCLVIIVNDIYLVFIIYCV